MTRLTFDGFNSSPTWSPDGRYVLFSPISRGIFQAPADGASRPQALTPSNIAQLPKRQNFFDELRRRVPLGK